VDHLTAACQKTPGSTDVDWQYRGLDWSVNNSAHTMSNKKDCLAVGSVTGDSQITVASPRLI